VYKRFKTRGEISRVGKWIFHWQRRLSAEGRQRNFSVLYRLCSAWAGRRSAKFWNQNSFFLCQFILSVSSYIKNSNFLWFKKNPSFKTKPYINIPRIPNSLVLSKLYYIPTFLSQLHFSLHILSKDKLYKTKSYINILLTLVYIYPKNLFLSKFWNLYYTPTFLSTSFFITHIIIKTSYIKQNYWLLHRYQNILLSEK